MLAFWLVAVGLEVLLGVGFVLTGGDVAIDRGLERAGLDFSSDLVTAARVVLVYPSAAVGVLLALGQVAAPDLSVWLTQRRAAGPVLRDVVSRWRPWSAEVGRRRGLATWTVVVAVFAVCNLASGLLHRALIPGDLTWHLSWATLALVPVAMFLDAGALFEESGWRGFALPAVLRRHGPVTASVVVGLLWATWHFPVKFDAFLDYGFGGAMAYLGAFTLKLVVLSVVITFFWARSGQSTLLAVAMHGLSNDVARVGGYADGSTWWTSTVSELDLAAPYVVVAAVVLVVARRRGWGDLRPLAATGQPTTP